MATIISDSFNRADSSTLGTADTGQAWTTTTGNWGIFSNQARSVYPNTFGTAFAVIEAGTTEVYAEMALVNPASWSVYTSDTELVFRYISSSYHWRYGIVRYGTSSYKLRLTPVIGGTAFGPWELIISPPSPGDTIGVSCCGINFTMYYNGAVVGTYTSTFTPPTFGTKCGLRVYPGTVPLFGGNYQIVDDFLVTTVEGCASSVSYNCVAAACTDPGDGTGTYATLQECLDNCAVSASYNCTDNECVDPGDGSGTYPTLADCLASGCGPTISTVDVDAGNGNYYYVVPPVVDSGDELRSKVVKAGRVTSKRTYQSIQMYTYDVDGEIVVTDLEDGTNSTTGALALSDNANVSQSPRQQVNCPNAVLSTVRVQGDDTGQTTRDRIDEIVVEAAEQGVRR